MPESIEGVYTAPRMAPTPANKVDNVDVLGGSLVFRRHDGSLLDVGPIGELEAAQYVNSDGDTITGTLVFEYEGAGTDSVLSLKKEDEDYPFFEQRADGRAQWKSAWAPAGWGTNSPGSVGNGSDFQLKVEGISNVAHLLHLQFPQHRVRQAGVYTALSYPGTFPMVGAGGTLQVYSTTGFAAAGTLEFSNNGHSTVGTITYTSKDATHFYGCTSTGIPAPTDIAPRHGLWLADSFGAPIMWATDYMGLYVNDLIHFAAGGVFPDNYNDIIIGYMNHAARTGNAIKFGSDGNVYMSRSDDGFGNNKIIFKADANILEFYSAGFFCDSTIPLGNSLHPWGRAYVDAITVSDSGDIRLGDDNLVKMTRTDDGFGNNQINQTADGHTTTLSVAGFYPNSALSLGTTVDRWGTAFVGMVRATGATAATDVFKSDVTGDTVERHVVDADGAHWWGPGGSGALDTKLYRSATDVLKTDDSLVVAAGLSVGSASGAPTGAVRASGGVIAAYSLTTQVALGALGPGGEAAMALGSPADTIWYRSAADTFRTSDTVTIDGVLNANGGANIGTSLSVGSNWAVSSTGYERFTEITAPGAPSANQVRLYAEDNGAGKTRLMAIFNTGAAQQVAIQP